MTIRAKIIHDFSRWAAASAARQGCDVRGGAWYAHIDQIDVEGLISLPGPISIERFNDWHRCEVESLSARSGVPIGWAAKIVNMITKIQVYIAGNGDTSLPGLIHPPIDNELINSIRSKYPVKGPVAEENRRLRTLCDKGKPIAGITTYLRYSEIIDGLRIVAERERCSLFEVESLWTG